MQHKLWSICSICGKNVCFEDMTRVSRNGLKTYRDYCKDCDAKRSWNYYQENHLIIKERRKNRIKNGSIISRVHCMNTRAKKSSSNGTIKRKEIEELFLIQKGFCKICGCSIAAAYEIDHIIPLSKEGSNTIDNIQLLCQSCNRHKSNKISDEYKKELEELVVL